MAAYKPWMTHTLFPYDVIFISDGKNTVENTQIWWCCVKIGEKWGIISGGKVQNGKRSTPLYRCFQRANFDTPHGHHEFCMRFWPAETDSHAVSHFMELCVWISSLAIWFVLQYFSWLLSTVSENNNLHQLGVKGNMKSVSVHCWDLSCFDLTTIIDCTNIDMETPDCQF